MVSNQEQRAIPRGRGLKRGGLERLRDYPANET